MFNFANVLLADKIRPDWVVNSFPIIRFVLMIIILLCSIFMIVATMMQQGNTNGMTGITGDTSDTFYNRNKGRSMQGKLKLWTTIVAISIFVLCLVYLVLTTVYACSLFA